MPEGHAEPTDETKSRIELEIRDKNRLVTFIDAVFAIAITLLGLEFVVPLLQHSDTALLAFLGGLSPKFAGYFLAFFLLGVLLNNNWRQFNNIEYADWKLFFINLFFLSFIVLVPFATSIWTDYADTAAGVLFFHCTMLLSSLTLYFNWSYVKRHPYLLRKGITSRTQKTIYYANISLPIASTVAIGFAFITPFLSNFAYGLVILISALAHYSIFKKRR
jgi:uncharacterized membrane protein